MDGVTIKLNGSSKYEGLKDIKEAFSLSSIDITNQYLNMTHLAYTGSIDFVVDGLVHSEGIDYTVTTVGGVTRITFFGSLASGGVSALVASDYVVVKYRYL